MSRRNGTQRHPTAKLKGGWSPEEDALLANLVKQFGEGHWSPIARALNEATGKSEAAGRIGKQCRERWNHHLSPGLRKGPWTPEEEVMVVDAHKRLGNRWSDIARCIPGRSENAVKNHWNASLRKRVTQDNPAGPLKEYLDTLNLAVTPRKRNAGGGGSTGGGSGGGGGSKRKRGQRDCDDSSSEESNDEDEDDDDTESLPAPVATVPTRSKAAKPPVAKRPTGLSAAAPGPRAATVATPAAGSGGCGGTSASVAAASTAILAPTAPSGGGAAAAAAEPPAARRFPSDSGAAAAAVAASSHAASGETAPEDAADADKRRRSKRVAAQVGNERLRNMVQAEQREAEAEAAAAAEAAEGCKTEPEDCDAGHCEPASDGEAMETESTESREAGGPAVEEMAAEVEAAAMVDLEPEREKALARLSRSESICESGLPFQLQALPATAAAAAAAFGAAAAAAAAAAPPAGASSPFCCGAARGVIAGADLPCSVLQARSTAAVADLSSAAEVAAEPPLQPAGGGGVAADAALPGSSAAPLSLQQQQQLAGGSAAGMAGPHAAAAGWAPLSHNWSTNNMQLLEAEQLARRTSYGSGGGGGGKVRPVGCGGAPDDCAPGALSAAAGVAATGPPRFTGGCTCVVDDEDLLLDTAVDFSGTLNMRHVASGSALFDYDTRQVAQDLTAVTAPPSPAITAAAAGTAAAVEQSAPGASMPFPYGRYPHLAAPNRTWTPPNLFDEPHLEFGCPDSPLHDGHVSMPYTVSGGGAEHGRGVAVGPVGAGPSVGFAAATAPMRDLLPGAGAATAAAAVGVAGYVAAPVVNAGAFGDLVGDGGAGAAISGVGANSSITSVGSPALSDLYQYSDTGGVDAGARQQQVGQLAAATGAAAAAAVARTFRNVDDPAGRHSTGAGVVLKRESSFSGCSLLAHQPPLQGAASVHLMAPFKPVAAPPPMAAGPTGTHPTSPFTPMGGAPAPLHTMPTAPASPVPWGVPLPPGHAAAATAGAPMHMPYLVGSGPPPPQALPQMPALPPPYYCYGVPPPPPPHAMSAHHHAQPSQQPPQQMQMQQSSQQLAPSPPPTLHGMYGGAPVLHAGHMHPYPHAIYPPPYAVMHALPPLPPPASLLADGQDPAQQPQGQGQGQQQVLAGPGPQHQRQQFQPVPVKPPDQPLYYVGPGYYYCPPGPYSPYGGLYSTTPYHAAPGQPPAVSMPTSVPPHLMAQPYQCHQQQQQQHHHALLQLPQPPPSLRLQLRSGPGEPEGPGVPSSPAAGAAGAATPAATSGMVAEVAPPLVIEAL